MTISEQPLSLVSLLASLSYALDLTEGQPMGHAIRIAAAEHIAPAATPIVLTRAA